MASPIGTLVLHLYSAIQLVSGYGPAPTFPAVESIPRAVLAARLRRDLVGAAPGLGQVEGQDVRRLGLLGALLVEVHDVGGVHAGVGQQFELLLEVAQQLGRRIGPHDRRRVAVERDDHGLAVLSRRERLDLVDHRAVAQVGRHSLPMYVIGLLMANVASVVTAATRAVRA